MAELPESVTKADKSNSGYSLKERLENPFFYQWGNVFWNVSSISHPPAEKSYTASNFNGLKN